MKAIPVQPEHAIAVGDALARAFMDDPLNVYVMPDEERRRKILFWMFPRWVRIMARHEHAYTTDDFAGGALWRSPELGQWTWIADQLRAGIFQAPFRLYPGEFSRFLKVHSEASRRMKKSLTTPHWMLDVLGVSPERHGQGVARRMLSPVLTLADEQRLPCYLITNKSRNIAIYNRFGFQVIDQGLLAGSEVMFYEMRRPSSSVPEAEEPATA